MPTLLLRIEGPMQSWGINSRFTERDTGLEPSKSGIIGLICAAMGREREEDVSDLAGLRMGVRVDREGHSSKDYHTVLGVPRADGSTPGTLVSNRYYLADACFLIALEGDRNLLEQIESSLKNPSWPIYLGRKAFLPSSPILLGNGVLDNGIDESIRTTPWLGRDKDAPEKLRAIIETTASEGEPKMDVPISYEDRTFAQRFVKTIWVETSNLKKGD